MALARSERGPWTSWLPPPPGDSGRRSSQPVSRALTHRWPPCPAAAPRNRPPPRPSARRAPPRPPPPTPRPPNRGRRRRCGSAGASPSPRLLLLPVLAHGGLFPGDHLQESGPALPVGGLGPLHGGHDLSRPFHPLGIGPQSLGYLGVVPGDEAGAVEPVAPADVLVVVPHDPVGEHHRGDADPVSYPRLDV